MSNDMETVSTSVDTPFDPLTQTFSILLGDGVTPVRISMADVDTFGFYNSKVCTNLGTQLGGTMIMLVVLLLITKESKKKTLVFALNVSALVLSMIRTILVIVYWTGPFSEAYAFFSGDYTYIPRSANNSSVATTIFVLLFLVAVESSLLLQTHILFKGLQDPVRHKIMMGFSLVLVLLTISFRFASVVTNIRSILDSQTSYSIVWLASATLITETITVWYFCLIFMGKLIYHIMLQRQMNTVIYKPLQVLSIMSGCTMIIPSAFAILEYFPNQTFPEAGSIALTLVAIMLPLSSAWAAASIDDPKPINFDGSANPHGAKIPSYSTGHTGLHGSAYDRKGSIGMAHLNPASATTVEHAPVASRGAPPGRSKLSTMGSDDGVREIEEAGIQVEKTYGVRTGSSGVGNAK